MKKRYFSKNNVAVAGVIEALLIVALVAVVISTIQLTYIPQIMTQREVDHMDDVVNQFSFLKSMIDFQGVTKEDVPITTKLTLGSREIPYFVTAKAYGELETIDEGKAGDCRINIQPSPVDFPLGVPLTSIKYKAYNSYFKDQHYILEGGGIIRYQVEEDNDAMLVQPTMTAINNSNNIELNFKIPLIIGMSGRNYTYGFGSTTIRTNYTTEYVHSGSANFVKIYTDYPKAWNDFLIQDGYGIVFEYYNNGYINVNLDDTTTPNCVEITPGTKTLNLDLTVVQIGVQIGPGIVIM